MNNFMEDEMDQVMAAYQQNGADQEMFYQKGMNDEFVVSNEEPVTDATDVAVDQDQVDMAGAAGEIDAMNQTNGNKRSVVVSEDDDSSPAVKKAHIEVNIRKLLPDLEKHWKPVEEDSNDFTSWTYLLQYVDQENELLCAREAYDTFLAKYPFCYGYWKKYADFEKRKGSLEDCEKVFRRGLKSIPLSVDLWVHYLNYVKATHENEEDYSRQQFESSIEVCGMEFRSDKLWEHYINWEKDGKNLRNVMALYGRVLATLTQQFTSHFQRMKEFVEQNEPEEILSVNEYLEIKDEISNKEDHGDKDVITLVKEAIIERRSIIHKKTEEEINARWAFEEAIKRPYFHVKPLEKGQLKNWKDYLDFEISKGDSKRIFVLFERCLIACALYEEYWLKYINYLESQPSKDIDKIRSIYHRGCVIHHPKKLSINLQWSGFEETQGDVVKAREILDSIEKVIPDSLHVFYRRISLERRQGNLASCKELFEKFIKETKNKTVSSQLTVKYARFISKLGDYDNAIRLLKESIDTNEEYRPKIIMVIIDLAMQCNPIDFELVSSTFDEALKSSISDEHKITFAHRKIEFHEDYGFSIDKVNEGYNQLQGLAKVLREKKGPEVEKPPMTGPPGPVDDKSGQNYNQYGQYANYNYQQPNNYGYNQSGTGWSAYQGYYE